MKIGFIKESFYLDWLSNPVLVPQSNGKWRTCINFTNSNKACSKHSFLLPCIDQLVDMTARHELLSFMDAYSGYNQIPMFELDKEHTSFITDHGLYYYKAMPFGLKNVGATYQRYTWMMVKLKVVGDHLIHLDEMFVVLRRYKMKLNPLKCAFGVGSGKFLGFMVNQKGIKANSIKKKIRALLDISSPCKPNKVMNLARRVAVLSRFVS